MINDLFIRPDFDNSRIKVSFTAPENCTKVSYTAFDGNNAVASGDISVTGNTCVSFEEQIPDFKPWSVEEPNLYKLALKLAVRGETIEHEQSFGMWKVHVEDRKIYYNNKLFYMRGFIRGREAHDHPNLIKGATKTEYYEKCIRQAKKYGFNFIRFHSVIPEDEFLAAADRLGMLCHVEIRKYYGKYQKEREIYEGDQTFVDEEAWTAALLRLRNHPCVLVYCLGNEINEPGKRPEVEHIRALTKELDSTRLFLDTTSRGEYDRDTVDLDVQHMSYFAPFNQHYDMFDDTIHLSIYGSVTGKAMIVKGDSFIMKREVPVRFPLIAHEVAHYNVLRDPYLLDKKFKEYGSEDKKPWWVGELIKMIEAKGHKDQFPTMLAASTRFQYMWIKQCFESIRKSPVLQGFHFLQLTDTDRYENANGLVDLFDDDKDIPAEKVLQFNSPTVLVADLPVRTFKCRQKITIPIHISNFPVEKLGDGTFRWTLKSKDGAAVNMTGVLEQVDLSICGNRKLCRIEIELPGVDNPQSLLFSCELLSEHNKKITTNQWDLWLFPDAPERIGPMAATVMLDDLKLYKRYQQIDIKHDLDNTEQLLIADKLDENVMKHLEQGKDVLLMYRIDENRDKRAPREKYYLPSTWERFKGVIWDRGHNCGGFMREHPVLGDFPHDGFVDWQFSALCEDCDKIDLDDFPVKVDPIIEGVDKAVRDRFDVYLFSESEFVYDYTMRKFAYLFELMVGKGRLMVAGMNFKGIETDKPEVCWMFESIVNYMRSDEFTPKVPITVEELEKYLLEKGRSKRIKERMMTQYWQLDDAPLESAQYWKDSEAWLREDD